MIRTRRTALLLVVCAGLALPTRATDKKQLQAALAAVDSNLKSAEGKRYDSQFGGEFSQKFAPTVRQCKQAESSSPPEFDLLVRLKSDGKVAEVLVYPETTLGNCTRNGL